MSLPEPTESLPSDIEARRESGMRIDLTISIGYQRHRPAGVTVDRWEARADSIGLILVGGAVVLVVLIIVIPRVLQWIGQFV